jgi:protein-disulfide isomerase
LSGPALAFAAAVYPLTATTRAWAEPLDVAEGDRVLGDREAPVTILEYSSLTCPHCAEFHRSILPPTESDWIETGKAKLVYRHFPLDRLALAAAQAVSCLESDKAFFAFLEILFKNQMTWARSNDPLGELEKLARLTGMSEERFLACVTDEAASNAVLAQMVEGRDAFGINSTPTLIVNGQKIQGVPDYDNFSKIIGDAYQGS